MEEAVLVGEITRVSEGVFEPGILAVVKVEEEERLDEIGEGAP